ncbi:MAG: class I SAM-dependent methyltransferase [Sandaracinaceae bacterium]
MDRPSEVSRKRAFPVAHHGLSALETFAETPRINRWYFEALADGLQGDVLEIGAGIGNMSALIAEACDSLTVSEMSTSYVSELQRRFDGRRDVRVVQYELGRDMPSEIRERRFDAIVSLNVIEHVEDDLSAVEALAGRLRPGGRLLSYVPACDWAYGSLDRHLLHYRRYGKRSFRALMEGAGLRVDRLHYMNAVGLLGWLLNGRLLRRASLSTHQTHAFDRLVPIVRRLERRPPPIGLGLICHATKL